MRQPSDDEIREELETHAAMSREHGREARARLAVQEEVRAVWLPRWVDTLLQDTRFTLRSWRRHPAYACSACFTLALCLGATTALFSAADRLLFRPLPYRDAGRLVSLGMLAPLDTSSFILHTDYLTVFSRPAPALVSIAVIGAGGRQCDLTEERPVRVGCGTASWNLLQTLGMRVAAGRELTALDDQPGAPRVALISHSLWHSRLGADPDLSGKSLLVDGQPVRVVGVLPPEFQMPTTRSTDILTPLQLRPPDPQGRSPVFFLRGFARLRPGLTLEQAYAALQPQFNQMLANTPVRFRGDVRFQILPLRDRILGDTKRDAWLLLAAVGALLLMGVISVANLSMARAASRQRELAVRSALGAGRRRLIRLALTEHLMLAVMSGIAGMALAAALLRGFSFLAPPAWLLFGAPGLDLRIFATALALSLFTGLLIGIWPALATPRAELLHGARATAAGQARIRFALVSIQTALTLALLGSAGLLLRTLTKVDRLDLGLDKDNLVLASVMLSSGAYASPESQQLFHERLQERLRYTSAFPEYTFAELFPPVGRVRTMLFSNIEAEGHTRPAEGAGGSVASRDVDVNYFTTFRIRMVEGRAFAAGDDADGVYPVIISRKLARRIFANSSPVGKKMRFGFTGPWLTVIGVAADVRNNGLAAEQDSEYYQVYRRRGRAIELALRTTLNPAAAREAARQLFHELDPRLFVKVETMEEKVGAMAERPRFSARLLAGFAALALLLAATGLAGVVAYLVTQRRREFGVRLALGATPAHIRAGLYSQTARWLGAGLIAGASLSWFAVRALRTQLFETEAFDLYAWSAAATILLAASALAAWRPLREATKVDPLEALRAE